MNQSYLKISTLKGSLVLGFTLLLSSCSNTAMLTKNSVTAMPNTTTVIHSTPTIAVNWSHVEAFANTFYENAPMLEMRSLKPTDTLPKISLAEKSYAKSFGVSVEEAYRRLTLQAMGSGIIEAVKQDLGSAFIEGYYINDDPNEFRVGVTTLNTVLADRYDYKFKHSEAADYILPVYIYPISDKTLAQINQDIAAAEPEIKRRYPYTWMLHYNPVKNTVNIIISFHPSQLPDETKRQKIEAELSHLIGHQVSLEVNVAKYSYRQY